MTNSFKTIILLSILTVIIMFFGQVFGGNQGLIIAFILALIMNMGVYWFSADLVLAQTRAKVVDRSSAPELYELVEHLARSAGLPTPKVAIVDDPAPNAFATGRNPQNAVVAVTSGLLGMMSREELAGVLSHELAHVKHRDILVGSIAATMAGVIMLLANMAQFAAIFGGARSDGERGNPLAALLLAFLAPLAAALIQAAISRSREYMADDEGANIAGTPYGLASALEKLGNSSKVPVHASANTAHMFIVNPLSARSLRNLFATHPPIDERIERLRR